MRLERTDGAAQAVRVGRLWARYVALVVVGGKKPPADPGDTARRRAAIQRAHPWTMPGWFWESCLEMSDCCVAEGRAGACDFAPRPCQKPSRHAPGTPGKVADIATRLTMGVALWHPQDLGAMGADLSIQEREASDCDRATA